MGVHIFSQTWQYQFEKLTNYYSMDGQTTPTPTLHFTIRFNNHRPLLLHSASTKSALSLSSSPAPYLTTPTPPLTQAPSSPSAPSSILLSFTPQLPTASLAPSFSKSWFPQPQATWSKEEEGGQERITLDESLIEELLSLDEIGTPCGQRRGLQQLHIQETESVRLESSTLSDDQYSEIQPLTEDERQFFTNFVQDSGRLCESVFRNVSLQRQDCRKVQLQERKRVIRNFFRPKSSFLKDDRTCCNSSNNIQSLLDSAKAASPDRLACPMQGRRMLAG